MTQRWLGAELEKSALHRQGGHAVDLQPARVSDVAFQGERRDQCIGRVLVFVLREHRSRGFVVDGVLHRMVGMTLEATGCEAAVGSRCMVLNHNGGEAEAEVVGFSGDSLLMMPTGPVHGMTPGARVVPTSRVFDARIGNDILGRVIDGAGQAMSLSMVWMEF